MYNQNLFFMKKILLFTLLAAIFVSCEGPMGPRGYDGKDGNNGLLSIWKVIEKSVNTNDWVAYPSNSNVRYYSVRFTVPEITENIFLDGVILCYLYYDGRQIILPSVRHYQGGNIFWTQTIDYEYWKGGIEIFVTNSDFYYPEQPASMIFVLQILY